MLIAASSNLAPAAPAQPLRIAVIGLVHGHVDGFFKASLKRPDIQIVGIAEPDRALFDRYAAKYALDAKLYFASTHALISAAHPAAVLVYTNTRDHRAVVEECASRGVHVMMEKPLAVSYADALAVQRAARKAQIHVIVNYETTWYASNKAVHDLLRDGALGDARKVVVHDGHAGPKAIHVQPEFFDWLTDPVRNGAGALFDFGCYGADLMTWLMQGAAPDTVTAVTRQLQPDIYPHVDDEADVILTYPRAVAILQGSWDWPFDRKDLELYGATGYVKTVLRDRIDVRLAGEHESQIRTAAPLQAPYDDSLRYFAAVLDGSVEDAHSPGSLDTNLIVTEILDAARTSAKTGRTVKLPLQD